MVESIIDFFSFADPNVRWVSLGISLMCAGSALVGVFAFLRKRALVGDAISHSILPGICVAFLVSGSKSPLFLLPGAFISAWISLFLMDQVLTKTKIKSDTAIALILSVFYGIGILLLTMIQNSGNAEQSGLDKFLFGKAASLVKEDVIIFGVFTVLMLGVVILFYRPFRVMAFNPDYARSLNYPVKAMEMLFSSLTVLAVAIGIQAVGVVLMAALLITPAASARYWTNNLAKMLFLAAVFGAFSGLFGSFVSYSYPRMPTGPWVVSVLSLIAIFSVFWGRKKGIWTRRKQQVRNHRKMLEENILKCLYHLGEKAQDWQVERSFAEIQKRRLFSPRQLKRGSRRLRKKGWLEISKRGLSLNPQGVKEGLRVVKIHRLWELYLTRRLQLAPDHVHEDAEAIEHIITPELEKDLERALDFPSFDPHKVPIPYQNQSSSPKE